VVHLACSPDVATVTGRYFAGTTPVTSSAESRDPVVARRLWEYSERLAGPVLVPA
jgi:hypothetical protein